MIAKTFKVKKIETMRDKRAFMVEFELENCEWSNFFELTMKKDDTLDKIRTRIIDKVKDMIAIKDSENELKKVLVGQDITLNGNMEQEK